MAIAIGGGLGLLVGSSLWYLLLIGHSAIGIHLGIPPAAIALELWNPPPTLCFYLLVGGGPVLYGAYVALCMMPRQRLVFGALTVLVHVVSSGVSLLLKAGIW